MGKIVEKFIPNIRITSLYTKQNTMALILIMIFFFMCHAYACAQIGNHSVCATKNYQSVKHALINSLGKSWYDKFYQEKGHISFSFKCDTLGHILEVIKYKVKGNVNVSAEEFSTFTNFLIRNVKWCIPNMNPELTDIDFKKFIEKGNFILTFRYVPSSLKSD